MERMNLDSIADLEIFEAVCKEGSFAKAAKRTRNSVPSISKRISRLEKSLKIILFNRTTRSMQLTEAGQNFLIRCERILSEIREAEKEAGKEKEMKGKIRMTAALPFANRILPECISEFSNLYPEISIEIVFSNEKSNLIYEQFDLAFRIMKPLSSPKCLRILPNPVIAVANPGYLDRVGTPTNIEELSKHKIMYVDEHSQIRIPKTKKRLMDLSSERQIKSNHATFLCEYAVNGGSGILFRSFWDVESNLRSGKLKRVLPNLILDSETMGCILFPAENISKRVQRFSGFLEEKIPFYPLEMK
ncbi:LysR family transcriptional regulator [Leptospira selangorensis]|uniref:LysR family transcriptional regulator n=1 Tax=Leptospira selangorensis TaxID=2484982 RepID=UPI001083FB9F|nr:LysR family transcriptional regulator [Leptospira selangorensis]